MQEKIKFLLTGGLNTFVGFLFYVFFLKVGFEYNVAIIFSTFCGSVFNYLSYSFGVFRRSLGWSYFARFLILYAFTMSFNIMAVKLFIHLGWSEILSGFFALPLVVVFSYFGQKIWVFANEKKVDKRCNSGF